MSTDGHVEQPKKGFTESDDPGAGQWVMIVDTENADTPTVLLGTGAVPVAIPLGTSDAVETPAQITVNQNNYTFVTGVGFLASTFDRLSTDASRDITGFDSTGITAVQLRKKLINVGSFDLVLKHDDGASDLANRILIPGGADLIMAPNDAVDIMYDVTSSRWRVV